MPEIKRALHFRDVLRDQIGGTAVAVAGKNQRLAAQQIHGAIRPGDLHAAHNAISARIERRYGRIHDDRDFCFFCGLP